MRRLHVRAALALVVSFFAVFTAFGVDTAASTNHPPLRIPVKEPSRPAIPSFTAGAMRPHVAPATRTAAGIRLQGLPMFRPTELDHAIAAARSRPLRLLPDTLVAPPGRPVPRTPPAGMQPGIRHALALPADPAGSGTGINPWWRYQEEDVPGGGHTMVNVGTGNLVLQDDDMAVPHKGLALAFRRTYNSQSPAVVSGEFVTWRGLYGTGWTNTFDAHVIRTSLGHNSIYDIDGARYDYVLNDLTDASKGYHSTTPGQYAVLAWDGRCGFTWTKKSGTVYYFYITNPGNSCPPMTTLGGYAGRIYQIIGRNRNTSITFSYAWDNGDASTAGKISDIYATAESGQAASLHFADVGGRRLLQTLVFPDQTTSVSYGYDTSGDLTSVALPANDSSGVPAKQSFYYQAIGSDIVLHAAGSPRYNQSCTAGACRSDGGGILFGITGTSAASSTVSSLQPNAAVNPIVNDGTTSGALQSGSLTTVYGFRSEYYTTGVTTPTYRDTEGHMTNWVVDGSGRPTQTQECTASANQGQQCTGLWLVTNETWDAGNNRTADVDARGYETDYAYDANGNTVAMAGPSTTIATAGGSSTGRPTSLFRTMHSATWSPLATRPGHTVTGAIGTSPVTLAPPTAFVRSKLRRPGCPISLRPTSPMASSYR